MADTVLDRAASGAGGTVLDKLASGGVGGAATPEVFKGAWTPGIAYPASSVVIINGGYYKSNQAITPKTTFSANDGWVPSGTASDTF